MTASSTSSSTGWTPRFFTLAVAGLAALSSVSAKYECDTSGSAGYPYCVNIPDGGENLPVILFLAGSGARGDASRTKELSGYDGVGKLINQYMSGNKGEAQSMAANDFVTIIPVSPMYASGGEVRHWWPQQLDKVLDTVGSKYGINTAKVHTTGYSMGCRGTWRYMVNSPDRVASASCSAGSAESSGDGTLSQQKADATFPMLKNAASIPMWQFAGGNDNTAGTKNPEKSLDQLESLGDSGCKFSVLQGASHNDMGLKPFDTNLLQWVKQNTGSGGSSSSSSGSSKKVSSASGSSDGSSESDSSSSSSTDASLSDSSSSSSSDDTKYKASSSSSGSTNPKSSGSSSSGGKKCLRKRSQRAPAPVLKRSLKLSDILAARQSKSSTLEARSEPVERSVEGADPHSKRGLEWFEQNEEQMVARNTMPNTVGNVTQQQQKRAHEAIKRHAGEKKVLGRRMSNRH